MVKRLVTWIKRHPNVIGFLILGTLFSVTLGIDRNQDRRERKEDSIEEVVAAEHDARNTCVAGNESRRLIREIGVELSVSGANANASALIAVVPEASPEVIEEFRRLTAEISRTSAETTVSALGPRDCTAEVCAAIRDAARIEGVELPPDRPSACT